MAKGTVTVRIIGDAGPLRRTLDSVEGKLKNFGASAAATGKKLSTHLTLPIAGVAAGIVKLTADYQRSMNTFQAVTGATATQMSSVGKLAKDLGRDMSLPGTSAKDAAEAMTELAKAGLSVTEAMAAAKGVLQLSAAAQIDNATAATIAANALNSFGLKGSEAVRVADLLAATANSSSAEITDVAEAMAQSSAVFAQAKLPIEDLAASIGILANKGIKGSDAGTSLKTMLMRLQSPVGKASDAMRKLGVSVFDSHGVMRPFQDIVGQFSTKLGKLNDEQKALALNTIFGTDAVRAASIVLGGGAKSFDQMRTAVTKQGAAGKVAGAKMKGLAGAMEGIKSAAETLAISFGEVLGPPLEKFMRFAAGLLNRFDELSPKIKTFVLIGAGIAAALGPAIAIVGTLATGIGFLVSPIGLIVAALAAVGVAFAMAWRKSEAFREGVRNAIDKVKGFVGGMMDRFKAMAPFFKSVWESMVKTAKTVGHALGKIISGLIERFGPFLQKFIPFVARVIGEAFKIAGAIIRNLMPIVQGIIGGISWAIEKMIRIVAKIINLVIHGINLVIRGINLVKPGGDIGTIETIDADALFRKDPEYKQGQKTGAKVPEYHTGGRVPGSTNKEWWARVRGQETVRTPAQEDALQRRMRAGAPSGSVELGPKTLAALVRALRIELTLDGQVLGRAMGAQAYNLARGG